MSTRTGRTPLAWLFVHAATLAAMSLLPVAAWSHQYSHDDCEFKVDFPAPPAIKKMAAQDGVSFEQAQLVADSYFLRAECFPSDGASIDADALMTVARRFAENEGLSGTQFSASKTAAGTVVSGRGIKRPAGMPTTYEFQCTVGKRSLLCASGGSPSHVFPQPEIGRFFQSVALKGASTPKVSSRWTRLGAQGFYLAFDSVQKGKTAKGWVLTDDGKPGKHGDLSSKVQYEVDCSQKRMRAVAAVGFSGRAGEGDVVYSVSNTGGWRPVSPDSVNEEIFTAICLVQKAASKASNAQGMRAN